MTILARTPDGTLPVRVLTHRRAAKIRADLGGYFWLPCDTCGQMWGGHEHGRAIIPDLERPPGGGHMICPACEEAGVHVTWQVVAPPGHLVIIDAADLDGPMGHLARARLGLAVTPPDDDGTDRDPGGHQ